MLRGALLSLILHVLIIFLIIYVIPEFFSKNKRNIEIAVDIITLAEFEPELSFTKQIKADVSPKPKEEEKKKVKDDNKIREVKKDKPKKKTPKKPSSDKKKKKASPKVIPLKKEGAEKELSTSGSDGEGEDDLDSLLDEIKRVQDQEIERAYRERYIYGKGLTSHEKQRIKGQINSCWTNVIKHVFSKEEIIDIKVKVVVSLDEEGNVLEARLADSAEQYMQLDNSLYRQVADSALSTFYRCNKIFNLPKDKYEVWKEFEFTFDPNEI